MQPSQIGRYRVQFIRLRIMASFALAFMLASVARAADVPRIIDPATKKHYVDDFNATEIEPPVVARQVAGQPSLMGKFLVPNAQAWDWMVRNVPMLDCPDEDIQEIYYYRWWTYRSHIKHINRSPYIVLTEFWERENPVSSAVGHHIMEGRWAQDPTILNEYIMYWLSSRSGTTQAADGHNFSSWTIWAAYQRYLVNGDKAFITGMLDDFLADYLRWERERLAPNGLYWQRESQDAMEESINGSRVAQYRRPTISSYMYGNALAIAAIARLAGRAELAIGYEAKAASIKKAMQEILWDPFARFFKVQWPDGYLGSFREEIGFVPWYFELPDKNRGYETAWAQLLDPQGFAAPFGITTAERRAPGFRTHGSGNGCEWDGAVWPFSTAHTLTALANVLNDYTQSIITKEDYLSAVHMYAKSQHKGGQPYIGEYLDEKTGQWLRNDLERGRHYNHSTYCDLIINGLIGVRPQADGTLEVNPLVPPGKWSFFCLDNVLCRGRTLSIIWDKTGRRYNKGAGFTLLVDGKSFAHASNLKRIKADMDQK
jgi:hypothetical protein